MNAPIVSPVVYRYDLTWEGMLTCIFDAFFRREQPLDVLPLNAPPPLFTEVHDVVSDEEKVLRVARHLEQKLSTAARAGLMQTLYSEDPRLSLHLFRFLYKTVKAPFGIERNMADEDVKYVTDTFRRVRNERLKMMQFVRFQKAVDGTYFAMIAPRQDVLPLIVPHFADRFKEETWLIYDSKRQYGYYYSEHRPVRITVPEDSPIRHLYEGELTENLRDEDEQLFQKLWKTYFKAICIRERLNPHKQAQDMPRRYWRYLTEKK